MNTPKQPPRWANRLLEWFCAPHLLEEVQGDLHERFERNVSQLGPKRARKQYAKEVISFLRPFALKRKQNEYPSLPLFNSFMLRNYAKTSFRNLIRNRDYTLINLVGLTLGLGVAIVLFWIVRFEYSFDRYHRNANRLYRIISNDKFGEKGSHVPQGLLTAIRSQIPGVDKVANVYAIDSDGLQVGQQVFNVKRVFFSPPQFLKMIDMEWVKGAPDQSLSQPFQVVLDEPTARRFFKNGDAMGKTIRIRNDITLTVTGIFRKMPVNTEFQFQVLASRETLKRIQPQYADDNYWAGGDSMHHGYVLLKPGTSASTVETLLNQLASEHKNESRYTGFDLVPIPKVHLDTQSDADPYNYVLPEWMLYTLAGIGLFLIVIACINFINLATVQAVQRSREIAVRKVLGSSRSQLITQFFGETAILVFTGIGLGSLLATQLMRYADQLVNTQVTQSTIWDMGSILFLLMLGALVTLLAGSYPALVLSGFQPIRILRSRLFMPQEGGITLRQSLVVTQFVIAQVLVICTLLGSRQIRYFYQKDLGFDKGAVVTINMPDRGNPLVRERFRHQLLQHPEIKDVAFALTTPSSNHNWWWNTVRHRNLPEGESTFRTQYVDTNYFHFFKIPLLAGRSWTRADTNTVLVVNEKAARDLGYKRPEKAIGERITLPDGTPFTIMGVVKDYHSQSLKSSIVPHIFLYADWNFQQASIRIDSRQPAKALAQIEQYWKVLFPNYYFEPKFLDQELKTFYADEQKLSNFLTLFAIVGIFIGCLGLLGLVSFVVTQRTKEIGIRKVLGATVASIITLLSKDFLKLVFIAFGIATPIAWYVMNQALKQYSYKIDIEWWVFALSGGLAVGISLLTVSFQSMKAALMNPVKSLRTD